MRILVTGSASGIGKEIARIFLKNGHTVYGIDIQEDAPLERYIPITADITCRTELDGICERLTREAITFDVFVHAAGVHAMLSLVESDSEGMERLMRVNVLGAMLVNRTFHSLLARNGRIVIITSEVATLAPLPFNGLYSVSKHALDAYAQALRQELQLIGQRVITVRPGAVETPLCRASLTATERLADETRLYKTQAAHFLTLTKRFMGRPMPPERLASVVYRAATCRRPRHAYHKHRNLGLLLLGILPARLQCTVIRLLLNRRSRKKKS